jgi:hypothetical protein
LTLQG